MAPFNTHFLIAEHVWPDLAGPWQGYYGQFCFGCVAPDVDKLSASLSQKDTHFFDRHSSKREMMASHRTATFLQQQDDFLSQPFAQLAPEGQAYILGYLCHLSVDEVSKYMWGVETWKYFQETGPLPAFAALDEVARQQTQRYQTIVDKLGTMQELSTIQALDLIPCIPSADLNAFLNGVIAFILAPTLEEEYLAVLEMFNQPTAEQQQQRLFDFQAKIDLARQHVHHFQLDTLLTAGVRRSKQRLADLIEGRVPLPGYPNLIGGSWEHLSLGASF